ncbi:hypothetical protein HDU90_005173 [Geranomyces variabilis]|nr:hypothetical protein HDU90_005173 [Geranomyces variabilis]
MQFQGGEAQEIDSPSPAANRLLPSPLPAHDGRTSTTLATIHRALLTAGLAQGLISVSRSGNGQHVVVPNIAPKGIVYLNIEALHRAGGNFNVYGQLAKEGLQKERAIRFRSGGDGLYLETALQRLQRREDTEDREVTAQDSKDSPAKQYADGIDGNDEGDSAAEQHAEDIGSPSYSG